MINLLVEVVESPQWLAHQCQLEAELDNGTACPFMGAACPLGIVSCGSVTARDWEEVLNREEEENDGQEV